MRYQGGKPRVSDHALLRYMERFMGIDLDSLRRWISETHADTGGTSDAALVRYIRSTLGLDVEDLRTRLLTPNLVKAMAVGAKKFTADGVTFALSGFVVTTIIDERAQTPRARLRNRERPIRLQDLAG